MAQQEKVYKETQAISMLKLIGVTEAELHQVVVAGETAKNNASILYPKLFPPSLGYAERVKVLRECLLPKGWKIESDRGLEMVTSPDGNTAILTSLGDNNTGDASKELKTKNRKGLRTGFLVEENAQMSFFDTVKMDDDEVLLENKSYWYLMVHADPQEIKCELSRPIKLDKENKLCGFSERIILASIKLDGSDKPKVERKNDLSDFEVVVSKKAN